MFLKRLSRNKKGVSSIISTLLIASIMVTSISLTYVYIIPTIDRGRMNAAISTSALFLIKMDAAIQSMMNDGVGASRTLQVDSFAGNLEFRSLGMNFRAFVNGSMYLPIPGLDFGIARITIDSDTPLIRRNTIEFLKGSEYYPPAVTDLGEIDPGTITLERTSSDIYYMELYYRLFILVKDEGVGGNVDVSVIVIRFSALESLRGLNSGTYFLTVNKTDVELNPAIHGFINNNPNVASGDDFQMTLNKGTGPVTVYTSSGYRSRISINLVMLTYYFQAFKLD
ncbi:MAG: hypothetical protein FK730_13590 [Asgard group archaeon]|nr:hypothetical protein [Asgard group archaeon]